MNKKEICRVLGPKPDEIIGLEDDAIAIISKDGVTIKVGLPKEREEEICQK